MKRPNSCTNLNKAIVMVAAGNDPVRFSRAMANVIIGQMLPDGVVKGGSSLMFRYGDGITRYTRDIDTARVMSFDVYFNKLKSALDAGWNGFTGSILEVEPPTPAGVPQAYVMQPFDIKLKYLGRPWQTVRIEIGHNEIGDAEEFDEYLPDSVANVFEGLGFPKPNPLPLMKLSYQIAQKIHASSEPNSERAHDLIDLQLMIKHSNVDIKEVKDVCLRLFKYRRQQSWPPTITVGKDWQETYSRAYSTIAAPSSLLPTVNEAVAWANDLIARINAAIDNVNKN